MIVVHELGVAVLRAVNIRVHLVGHDERLPVLHMIAPVLQVEAFIMGDYDGALKVAVLKPGSFVVHCGR